MKWLRLAIVLVVLGALASPAASAPYRDDPTVTADLKELRRLVRTQLAPFDTEAVSPRDVLITFIGKAGTRSARGNDEWRLDDPRQAETPAETMVVCVRGSRTEEVDLIRGRRWVAKGAATFGACDQSWRAFNPATRNEFRVDVPAGLLGALHDRQEAAGATRAVLGSTADERPRTRDEAEGQRPGAQSISDGVDNRVRLFGTTGWPWRTIADMGGCTGTFVGPRHVVTAGHCLYSRSQAAWFLNITVAPGRNAGSLPYGSTSLPPGPGESGWYFTPSQWRADSPAGGASQYDFGIIVVPDRLGDQTGWMGYVTRPAGDLQASFNYLRGYPFCESQTAGTAANPERIDEPDNTSQAADGTVPPGIGSCTINGLYGTWQDCSLGEWSKGDGSWWRRVRHSCDAGAANSGSALYQYWPASPNAVVFGVHTTSLKCARPVHNPCTGSDDRPLEATRLTVEYRNWISFFRAMFP